MAAHPVDLSTLADGSSCSLASLHVESILKDMPGQKLTFVHAKSTEEKDAVLILEKTPIDQTLIQAALSDRSTARVDVKNDVYHNLKLTVPAELNCLKGTLIYPATSKHIEKYSDQEVCMVNETPLDYEEVTKPYMLEQEQYLKWVYNLLDHKAEAERIVFEDPDPETGFILAPDLKWDGTTMENMYLTAIVRKKHLLSLRELTTDHLPLLKNVLDKGTDRKEEIMG